MFNIHSIKTKLVVVLAIIMGLLLLGQILFITPIIKEANRETAFIINGFVFAFIVCAVILTVICQVAFRPLNSLLENIKSGKFQTGKKYPKHEVGQLAKEFNSVYSNLLQSGK